MLFEIYVFNFVRI